MRSALTLVSSDAHFCEALINLKKRISLSLLLPLSGLWICYKSKVTLLVLELFYPFNHKGKSKRESFICVKAEAL